MKTLTFIPALLFLITVETPAQSFITETGYAEFESSAPLLTFKGTSDHLVGWIDLEENTLDFYLDLNTLRTGINRRDRDMRTQYLETDRYPFAEFTGSIESGFSRDLREPQDVRVKGEFTIHGVTREIEVEGTLTPDSEGRLQVEAAWIILLADYNIDRPRVLFYELAEEQKVSISAQLEPHTE